MIRLLQAIDDLCTDRGASVSDVHLATMGLACESGIRMGLTRTQFMEAAEAGYLRWQSLRQDSAHDGAVH